MTLNKTVNGTINRDSLTYGILTMIDYDNTPFHKEVVYLRERTYFIDDEYYTNNCVLTIRAHRIDHTRKRYHKLILQLSDFEDTAYYTLERYTL